MKVRCVRLLDSLGDPIQHSAWAKVGAIYHVLSISIEPRRSLFRLVAEGESPALFDPEMFEIVSSVIPESWIIVSHTPGCLSIAPKPWTRVGFWQEYFDRKPEALKSFEVERQRIVAVDP